MGTINSECSHFQATSTNYYPSSWMATALAQEVSDPDSHSPHLSEGGFESTSTTSQ